MNAEMQFNNRRPRPQAAPEIVSQSCSRNTNLAAGRDFRASVPAREGYSASADAIHPARQRIQDGPDIGLPNSKSAAQSPKVIVEVAPDLTPPSIHSAVHTKSAQSSKVIVEVAPDLTPPSIQSAANRKSTPTPKVIVEVSPDLTPPSIRSAASKAAAPKRVCLVEVSSDVNAPSARLSVGRKVIVEISPDVNMTSSRKVQAQSRKTIVEVSPDINSSFAGGNARNSLRPLNR